jgi:peptidoglycan-associated lipoprotein
MEVPAEMKMERKWIVMALTLVLVLPLTGCKPPKAEPTVDPPPPIEVSKPPVKDVKPEPMSIDEDPVEPQQPKSLADIQKDVVRMGLLGDIFYSFDQYDLRADARERLAKNAEWMKSEGQGLTFNIEGHCDERGTNEYNIALGQSRSSSAVDYLISLGVDARRFKTVSFGEERPFCTETSEACWQKNRRAHFEISGRR